MRQAIVYRPLLRDIAACLLTTATFTSACSLEVNNGKTADPPDGGAHTDVADDPKPVDPDYSDASITDETTTTTATTVGTVIVSEPVDPDTSNGEGSHDDDTNTEAPHANPDAGYTETSASDYVDAAPPEISPNSLGPRVARRLTSVSTTRPWSP